VSTNISALSSRKGLRDNLFERLVEAGPPQADSHSKLAREYLLGEAVTFGAASFYDLLSEKHVGKKALVCDGSACLCAGTQDEVVTRLETFMAPGEIGTITCLGRCHENRAFHFGGRNFSGSDLDRLESIVSDPQTPSGDDYAVGSTLEAPVLTGPFPGVPAYYGILNDLLARSRDSLLEEVKTSNLGGRGGAGFPTGLKWASAKQAAGDKKYIICNADEGDPGAYIDRYLMEQQPHRILFGMLAAGYAVGADEGVLYIRAEYPESIASIKEAIREAKAAGFAGKSVAGSDFSFEFKVVAGAGAYICGEETALIASLEGRRPEVSVRPPFPTTRGLFGKPTVVNNAESFANIHEILRAGGAAFAATGTPRSTGPKLVSLNGVFKKPGLYETFMGEPLANIVEGLGGGFTKPVKALHIGGPLGGIVPARKIGDLTLDFETFREHGFLLGHGSILAVPEDIPMIEYMEHIFEFCAVESCGKCFPCRVGATRGQEMMVAAVHGERKINRELLDDLLETMELGSLCAHGGGIPLPLRNALEHFADELQEYFESAD